MAITTTATLTKVVQDLYNADATRAFTARGVFWHALSPEHIRQVITGPGGVGQGDVVKIDVWGAATAATTPLGETSDGTADTQAVTQVDVTLQEHGKFVQTSGKLRATAYGPLEKQAAWRMGDVAIRTLDLLARVALDAQTGATWVGYGSGGTTNATSVSTITKGNTLNGDDFRAAASILDANNVPPFPDGYYRAFIHPHVFKDLKSESDVHQSFTAAANYAGTNLDPIRNERGIFEGFRIITTSACNVQADAGATVAAGTSADVYTSYFVGPDSLAMGRHGNVPSIRLGMPKVRPGSDAYGRYQTIGWYGLLGFAALQDDATYKIYSSSSMDTAAT